MEPDLKGYGWYFPKDDVLNIGIGVVSGPGANLPKRRDALVASLRASGHLPADLPIEPFRGHAYVVRRRAPRRLAGPGFCLDRRRGRPGARPQRRGHRPGHPEWAPAPPMRSRRIFAGARRSTRTPIAIVRRYGRGETGWLGRQLGRLPDAVARVLVRATLATGATRRHVVLGGIFGMREVPS